MNTYEQQAVTDIENQYSKTRFWNIKIPGRPETQDKSTDVLKKYFKGPEHPWNKPNGDIENQLKIIPKLADVDKSKAVLSKYFTDPNEPWNKC